jgi:hypothetical protein
VIKIHNIRLGHPTNSSSTHSVIILGEPVVDAPPEREAFGWDTFTLSSAASKRAYLAQTLRDAMLKALWDEEVASAVCAAWLGHTPDTDGDVDHQSLMTLPSRAGSATDVPAKQFVEELAAAVLADGVVILGGNDNSENGVHPLLGRGPWLALPPIDDFGSHVCRKDAQGFWTILNQDTGAKVRLTLGATAKDNKEPARATLPELVDISITSYCRRDCDWCYADATVKGRHADLGSIQSLARALQAHEVMEVVLGGGEPASHPQLKEVVDAFLAGGMTVGITTHDLPRLVDAGVLEKVSAVGVSVKYAPDVLDAFRGLPKVLVNERRARVHIIAEAPGASECIQQAAGVHLPILLLGAKRVGRGAEYDYWDTRRKWLDQLGRSRKDGHVELAVDTAFAKRYTDVLSLLHVPKALYTTNEGRFSMFVDAVTGKAGPCSYCAPDDMVQWGERWRDQDDWMCFKGEDLEAMFARWAEWEPGDVSESKLNEKVVETKGDEAARDASETAARG